MFTILLSLLFTIRLKLKSIYNVNVSTNLNLFRMSILSYWKKRIKRSDITIPSKKKIKKANTVKSDRMSHVKNTGILYKKRIYEKFDN